MRLEWTEIADEDLDAIVDYIALERPLAALSVDERIQTQAELLADFPNMGHPGRVEGTREFSVPRTSCLLIYQVETEAVRILRVLHGAQLWP